VKAAESAALGRVAESLVVCVHFRVGKRQHVRLESAD
jgi:hypothetical protein